MGLPLDRPYPKTILRVHEVLFNLREQRRVDSVLAQVREFAFQHGGPGAVRRRFPGQKWTIERPRFVGLAKDCQGMSFPQHGPGRIGTGLESFETVLKRFVRVAIANLEKGGIGHGIDGSLEVFPLPARGSHKIVQLRPKAVAHGAKAGELILAGSLIWRCGRLSCRAGTRGRGAATTGSRDVWMRLHLGDRILMLLEEVFQAP
jgi:hypothetical protein